MQAASTLFEHRGYYGTSLRVIAREAHITPSLLQKYFPCKEAIMSAFVEKAMDELDEFIVTIRRNAATEADAKTLMREVGLDYINFVDRMRGFYLTWIMCPELIEPYRETLPEFITIGHKLLAEALADRTGLDPERALMRVRIMFAAIFAFVMYYTRLNFPGTRREGRNERLRRLVDAATADPDSLEATENLALP
ncbi:MAG TPA: TetR/AcrR family transcriptional regulator [Verrucomicrobiae bacterium]|nr:TetR/AcrR family transcriptional regulator [Verrucomicrobiae bacterium]